MRIGIIAIVAVAVIGGGVYVMTRPDSTSNANTSNQATNTASTPSTSRQSMAELAASGQPTKCTFTINDATQQSDWTLYTADQKVRGDFTSTTTGSETINGHVINNDEYHYNWGTRGTTSYGTKLKLSVVQNANTNANTNSSTSLDEQQDYDMTCERWTVDTSKFTPPSDVTFTDLSAQLQANPALTESAKTAACAACDSSTDEASKAQCRQILGC